MKTLTKIIFAIMLAAILLCGLAACGIIFPQSTEKPPISKATGSLVGEFVTKGGSKLTFIDDGGNDWSSGDVLVEFAADSEYLLEGRENNKIYRYSFSYNNISVEYDVAERFELYDGEKMFAGCNVKCMNDSSISLYTTAPDGVKIEFERAEFTKED
jgi:hypothetical protein